MTEVENEVSEEIISVFCSLIHICELFINIERKWQKEFPLCASEKQYKALWLSPLGSVQITAR